MRSVLVLLACLAFPALAQDAASRPEVKAGDRWTYRRIDLWNNQQIGRPNYAVAFASPKAINVVQMRNKQEIDLTFTAEWNAVTDAEAGVYTPHTGFFRFPLAPGDAWRSAFETRRLRQGAFRVKHDIEVRVAGWEDVVVPAGRFRALKVEVAGTFQRVDVFGNGKSRWVFWYVPEVRRWVKLSYEGSDFRSQPHTRYMDELLEYRLR